MYRCYIPDKFCCFPACGLAFLHFHFLCGLSSLSHVCLGHGYALGFSNTSNIKIFL